MSARSVQGATTSIRSLTHLQLLFLPQSELVAMVEELQGGREALQQEVLTQALHLESQAQELQSRDEEVQVC
jgi:hypothetical protein